nr:hypothetical protein BaRGS_019241 [Batillaria attramentaria]
MASAKGDKLTDLVASIPAQEEFLIYDIRGDLSSDDVLAAFRGFKVPYKFKRVIPGMVMKDSSDHKKYASLSFPGASQVDVYPAEHLSDYWGYFGLFVFMPIRSYALDRAQLEATIVYDGPFQTNVVTTPIVNM